MRLRLLGLVWLAIVLPAVPAQAHAGGRAQLYVAAATVTPQNGGWAMSTVLRDLDSGAPEPGFAVEVSGKNPSGATFGPFELTDPDGDGRYDAKFSEVAAGNWLVTLRAGEVPGGPSALPLQRTWTVALQPGQPVSIAGDGPPGGSRDSGSSAIPITLAIAGVAVLAATWRGRRRRSMVPVR